MEASSYVSLMGATTINTESTKIDIDGLAWAVAEDGPAAHHDELVAVARNARNAGVASIAASVLADRDAPHVARQRAFALVAAELMVVRAGSPLYAVA
jgi:hypothetical protein